MAQSLDKIWTDLCYELEVAFTEARDSTNWRAFFDSADVGPNITTPGYDHCWVTRTKPTVVICMMRFHSRPQGDNERTFQFRLDGAAALPMIRVEEGAECPESAESAARWLVHTFRELATPVPDSQEA